MTADMVTLTSPFGRVQRIEAGGEGGGREGRGGEGGGREREEEGRGEGGRGRA